MKTIRTATRATCLLVALGLAPTAFLSPLNAGVACLCVVVFFVLS